MRFRVSTGLACVCLFWAVKSGSAQVVWSDNFDDGNIGDWIVSDGATVGMYIGPLNDAALARSAPWCVYNNLPPGGNGGPAYMSKVISAAAGQTGLVLNAWMRQDVLSFETPDDWFELAYRLSSGSPWVTTQFFGNQDIVYNQYSLAVVGAPTTTFEIRLGFEDSADAEIYYVDDVSLEKSSAIVQAATRDIQAIEYTLATTVSVVIDLTVANAGAVTLEETVPAGWVATNISDGGTQTGDVISWSLSLTADLQIGYDVFPRGGIQKAGVFDGVVHDPTGDIPIGGETQIGRAGAGAPIIFIYDFSDNDAGDANAIRMLGPEGITVGSGVFVPGTGYGILEVDEGDAFEATHFTTADGSAVLISSGVGSGNIASHAEDPLPILDNEPALVDDRANRGSMFFCNTAWADPPGNIPDQPAVNITNNTHEITSIFQTGNLIISNLTTSDLLPIRGVLATAVLPLAVDPVGAVPVFAVAEQGATPMSNPAVAVPLGADPTPARRAVGPQLNNCWTSPTAEGVYLLQRTMQWLIGDPVTAGTPAPAAPSGLTAANNVSTFVDLNWTDNSDNENGFVIARLTSGTTSFVDIGQVRNGVTSYNDQTAEVGETYTYRVRAFNPAGESTDSNDATVTIIPVLDTRNWRLYR